MKKYFRKLFTLSSWVQHHDQPVPRSIILMMLVFPAAFMIFIATRIHAGDMTTIFILSITLVIILFLLYVGLWKRKQPALFAVAFTLLVSVTLICTFGQGIHDIGIVAFPAILIICSLMMNKKSFIILTLCSLAAIFWLVFGANWYLFIPKTHDRGMPSDFLVVATILLISAGFSYLICDSLRKSLNQVKQDLQLQAKVEFELQQSINEKTALLQEIHHRVKNNLSVICSLLNLQQKQSLKPEDLHHAFQDIQNRITAMSLVHEQLYHSDDLSRIHMSAYVNQLTRKLIMVYDFQHRIALTIDIDEITLNIETAIPCGIILNEIITNSFKHAFTDRKQGKIHISMKESDGRCRLEFKDNGPGLPDAFDPDHVPGLGLNLVSLLTRQLEGELKITNKKGIMIRVDFPLKQS